MSAASMKWAVDGIAEWPVDRITEWAVDATTQCAAGAIAVRRGGARKLRRQAFITAAPDLAIAYARLPRIRDRAPRRALARVERALFALTLGTVACLWLVQATGGF